MKVLIWLREGLWEAAVDAGVRLGGPDAELVLLHVTSSEVSEGAERELFAAARARLGRDAAVVTRHGRIEREVTAAAADADLLVVSRDGDLARLGPHSLGPATRFVVDHAPCPVLLVWPETAPSLSSIPPPPPPGHRPPPPPH